jgi:hypothetical protein
MSFFCFPPNFFLAEPVNQSCSSENNFSKALFKKNNLFQLRFKNRDTIDSSELQLLLNDSSELSICKTFKQKKEHNSFFFNDLTVHVDSKDVKHSEKSIFNILLDNYFKSETSNEIKSILKNTVFLFWYEKQLYSFWTKEIVANETDIAFLIELLDSDIYNNNALIALGEKLLKTIKNQPNKYQNLFNVYFKIGNCYFHENEPKKAHKYYKKAAAFLNYIDVHHHFLFYFNLAKTKKSIGLVTEIEERNLIYFYLSKENWEKKLYKNDLKDYFQISA